MGLGLRDRRGGKKNPLSCGKRAPARPGNRKNHRRSNDSGSGKGIRREAGTDSEGTRFTSTHPRGLRAQGKKLQGELLMTKMKAGLELLQ